MEVVGTSVTDFKQGQYVAVHSRNPCGKGGCNKCSIDADNLCTAELPIGLGRDGCYAQYVLVRAHVLVPIEATPEELAPELAAVATDAVLTSYHALKTAQVTEGQTVIIFGAGGLGLNAIQIAKVCGSY